MQQAKIIARVQLGPVALPTGKKAARVIFGHEHFTALANSK